jgi:hypothetical protein
VGPHRQDLRVATTAFMVQISESEVQEVRGRPDPSVMTSEAIDLGGEPAVARLGEDIEDHHGGGTTLIIGSGNRHDSQSPSRAGPP